MNLKLEFFEEADFDQLINWIDTPQLMQEWAGGLFRFPLHKESLKWYLTDTNDLRKSHAFVFKVVEEETGRSLGHASLGNISFSNQKARITRVFIAPDFQGRGLCSKIIALLIDFGFRKLNLHRVELGVYAHKFNAINCYKKAGMSIEGTQRDILKTKDGFWSMVEMSILRPEWEQKQGVHMEK